MHSVDPRERLLTMLDGNDRVYARAGDDMVDGGGGNDRLREGRGDDTLLGGGGDDRLKGGQDDDYLDGDEGDDRINARGDGREHVKYPKGGEPREESCVANSSGCDESLEDPLRRALRAPLRRPRDRESGPGRARRGAGAGDPVAALG